MIKIRGKQIEAFKEVSIENFENMMVRHLQEFSPPHFRVIGHGGALEVIRLGIEQAGKYNLTNRGPVRFYIEMMFMFGSAFDTDPQFPWAQRILMHGRIVDQMDRSEQLYRKAMDYITKVGGPQNSFIKNALSGIRRRAAEPRSFSADSFESEMLWEMRHIYPEKCSYVGDLQLRELIQEGLNSANKYSAETMRGKALFAVLMFALGHGFAQDPLFPWVSVTLKNPRIDDPAKRVQRLESKSITYLDHVLAYFAQE